MLKKMEKEKDTEKEHLSRVMVRYSHYGPFADEDDEPILGVPRYCKPKLCGNIIISTVKIHPEDRYSDEEGEWESINTPFLLDRAMPPALADYWQWWRQREADEVTEAIETNRKQHREKERAKETLHRVHRQIKAVVPIMETQQMVYMMLNGET